jgi:hypothetical protein
LTLRYFTEIQGDFNPVVFAEDSIHEGFVNVALYPNYTRILRDTKGGQELIQQQNEQAKLGGGSKFRFVTQVFTARKIFLLLFTEVRRI